MIDLAIFLLDVGVIIMMAYCLKQVLKLRKLLKELKDDE